MYKFHLILKYLRKRRIAWWALFAVALCTMMVLVVISVMGGWLDIARTSFRGLSGDLLIEARSLNGFPYYDQMIAKLKTDSRFASAVPLIRSPGLININDKKPCTVEVLGVPIDRIGLVNGFPESLYRQYQARLDAQAAAKDSALSSSERDDARRDGAATRPAPSFNLIHGSVSTVHVALTSSAKLLADFFQSPVEQLLYDPATQTLTYRGRMESDARDFLLKLSTQPNFTAWLHTQTANGGMSAADEQALLALSNDAAWPGAIAALYANAIEDGVDYTQLNANKKSSSWPGMIAGSEVLDIGRDETGKTVGRDSYLYSLWVTATFLKIDPGQSSVDGSDAKDNFPTEHFWIVDDSHTKVWQYDSNYVYVPFDVLQNDLDMNQGQGLNDQGQPVAIPARCSEVDVKLAAGVDLDAMRDVLQQYVDEVWRDNEPNDPRAHFMREPVVSTWEQSQSLWLGAIEKEKSLVTFLFGLVSIVAIFLIFCIFYMIVMEKTRDIGIIKSVGATGGGIAAIFLGYGLVIGIVGAATGLLGAWLLIHNINEIHGWMSRVMHITIWDPRVYAFDTIPSTMNPHETTIIVVIAVVSSVLGALLPAVRAARMNPIEAIRWE